MDNDIIGSLVIGGDWAGTHLEEVKAASKDLFKIEITEDDELAFVRLDRGEAFAFLLGEDDD